MKVTIKGFIYHKTAERYSDCFDRYGVNSKTNKFAISDGISKSFFPGIWAQLLIEAFVNIEDKINLADTELLKSLQTNWLSLITDIVNKPNQKYFVRNSFFQGRSAAATFVGLNFLCEGDKYKWEAFALGDSFLFFIPESLKDLNNQFEKVTYLSSKKDFEFDNFPDFFDSKEIVIKGKIQKIIKDLEPGTFYLMTDALSEWFISEKDAALDEIGKWKNQSIFENRIKRLRNMTLQNDDVAILIIKIENDNTNGINYENIEVTDINQFLEIEKIISEKMETEMIEIEKSLNKDIDKERIEEIKKLKQKYEKENFEYTENLLRKQEKDIIEARNQLLNKQKIERENFEYQFKRKQELERNEVENKIKNQFEIEIIELHDRLNKKIEEQMSEKSKEITKKYDAIEYKFVYGNDLGINNDSPTDSYLINSASQIKEIDSGEVNNLKDNPPPFNDDEIKKKKRFWEINIFESKDKNKKDNEDEEEMNKRLNLDKQNNDELNSETDKF